MEVRRLVKQIFWLLFFVTVFLLLAGWRTANSNLTTAITHRITELHEAFRACQMDPSAIPNRRWTNEADELNRRNAVLLRRSGHELFSRQFNARRYPRELEAKLRPIPFGTPINDKALRQRYRAVFEDHFSDQLRTIRPFDGKTGVVDLSSARFLHDARLLNHKRPVTSLIWQAEEDIWLMSSVFGAIARVNEKAERIDQAVVRSLELLQLRGGTRKRHPPVSAHQASFPGWESTNLPFGGNFQRTPTQSNAPRGAWSPFAGNLSVDLLTELFGAAPEQHIGSKRGFGGPLLPNSGTFTSGAVERYVDDDPALPYRTRAVAITVQIIQREIPKLLAELANAPYPVEIMKLDVSFQSGCGAGDENFRRQRRRPETASVKESSRPTALTAPDLCRLRIAGLMIIYRPVDSSDSQTNIAEGNSTQDAAIADTFSPRLLCRTSVADNLKCGPLELPVAYRVFKLPAVWSAFASCDSSPATVRSLSLSPSRMPESPERASSHPALRASIPPGSFELDLC